MIIVTVKDAAGQRALDLDCWDTVANALIASGARLPSLCGGNLSCGACHVVIEPPITADIGPLENELLELADVPMRLGSRLACQVAVDQSLRDRIISIPVQNHAHA